jgi:organic radical activating enzyme
MLYTFNHGKVFTKSIEYSVSYHCNLRCSQCSHLSPFVDKQFPAIESFESDIYRLSEALHAKVIRLLGGEPLLNPNIDMFIKTAKKSGIADAVMVTTNGLLLHKMSISFWKNVDYILVSLYPDVNLKKSYSSLIQQAKNYSTKIWFQMVTHFRTTIVTQPHKKDWVTDMIYHSCRDVHLFHCHMIHDGLLYKCAVPPFLPQYLAKMNMLYDPHQDGFAIHRNSDLYYGLINYLNESTSKEACRYCLGYVGKKNPHRQLSGESLQYPALRPITRKNNLDYAKFAQEVFGYFRRRVIERFSDESMW